MDSDVSISPTRLGAVPISETETQFRVWAPKAKQVSVEIVDRSNKQFVVLNSQRLDKDEQGIHAGIVSECPAGALYWYKLDGGPGRPDPVSRFQPFGVHGPSQVVDPNKFTWTDQNWTGVKKRDLVVYELHVGSFTQLGTYQSAIEELNRLVELGITAVELLPVAQTPGRWNWGYDGVNYFAPRNTFGKPDDLKAFINACHTRGLAVLLDVVYNHVGPEGNYLNEFGYYRSKKHNTPWGDSLNFDGPGHGPVREFVIANMLYWIHEFHFDGLRLDAIHYMFDDSQLHIVDQARQRFMDDVASLSRTVHLIAETNIYDQHFVGPVGQPNGQPHYDAIWSDCLMHSLYSLGNPDIRLTNRQYTGADDVALALEHAYVFSAPQAIRVTPQHRAENHSGNDRQYIGSLVMALQTHDSVGNHPNGMRLHQLTSFEFQKAAAPLILLYPSIPMIFMGEEGAVAAPFPFFADFEDTGLRDAVDKGRRDEYPHHDWSGSPLPSDPLAFYSSKFSADQLNPEMRDWYRQLLKLRRAGLSAGWLDHDAMSTEHDLTNGIFQLIFQTPTQRTVIVARLATAKTDSVSLELPDSAQILLDSCNTDLSNSPNPVQLNPQHCLVWQSKVTKCLSQNPPK